jgi:endoglucanase
MPDTLTTVTISGPSDPGDRVQPDAHSRTPNPSPMHTPTRTLSIPIISFMSASYVTFQVRDNSYRLMKVDLLRFNKTIRRMIPRFVFFLFFSFATSLGASKPVYFSASFDAGPPPDAHLNQAMSIVQIEGRGGVLHVVAAPGETAPHMISIPLQVDELRGNSIFLGADVRGQDISNRPNPWNGVKVMLMIERPAGTEYPQAEIPVGSFDWKRFSTTAPIPADATAVTLLLGLEQVSGQAWFDQVRVTQRRRLDQPPAADPSKPIFRGHGLARLRGAMAGTRLTENDIEHFASSWGGNVLRWQLFEAARQDRPLDRYDAWLLTELQYLDRVLGWCRERGVMIVVDLHSPPGGEAFAAGYITARGNIFRKPEAQAKFIEVWQQIARRYRDNDVIWGFDLLNEPDDSMLAEGCLDWQDLAEHAALAIRAIDPDRTLIVEPNGWGSPLAFASFHPLPIANCVYSFHLYAPHQFTHQGIHGNPTGIVYPGVIAGQSWDKAALREHIEPAVAFANRYRIHFFVGEFSAIRIAPEGSAARYLADATGLFEELGYDWTYHAYREWHGWSLEHEGSLQAPRRAGQSTDREQAITRWFKLNQRPAFR